MTSQILDLIDISQRDADELLSSPYEALIPR